MADSSALPEPDVGAYTAEQLRFAIEAWPLRAEQERRSAFVFGALARAARAAGVERTWTARFASAARDEVRHARLCTSVGARLGARPPVHDVSPVRAREQSLRDPALRAITLILVEVAIGETLSCGFFEIGTQNAREPLTRAALAIIAADEARHARLGWEAVAALWPALGAPRHADVAQQLTHALGAIEKSMVAPALRRLDAGEAFDPMWAALGVLPPEERVSSFYASLEDRVLPRIDALGLDAQRAWTNRYRAE